MLQIILISLMLPMPAQKLHCKVVLHVVAYAVHMQARVPHRRRENSAPAFFRALSWAGALSCSRQLLSFTPGMC